MGLTISKNNTESINWDKIDTEAMSSTLPALKKISTDAENLISQLKIEDNVNYSETDVEGEENIFAWLKNIGQDKKEEKKVNNEENFSDTSPFFSSEMYKYLVNKNSEESPKKDHEMHGGNINDGSSTSSTSDSETQKKNSKKHKQYTESSVMSGGDLSYISSSAHTNHNTTDDNTDNTSISVGNNHIFTSSINTNDINLVSSD